MLICTERPTQNSRRKIWPATIISKCDQILKVTPTREPSNIDQHSVYRHLPRLEPLHPTFLVCPLPFFKQA